MPRAINTFIPDSFYAPDRSKHNQGGLDNPNTLIDQGDVPVNVADLQSYDEMYKGRMDDGYMDDDYEDPYLGAQNTGGDIQEGVSLTRTMYQHEHVRKNSDY